MQLSEKQTNLLEKYRELLIYGSSLLEKTEIDQRKTKLRKIVFHSMMTAHQSYSEALLALMVPPGIYDKAAEAIYRSLVENFINVNYIYSGIKQERTYIFLVESWQDRIDFARKQHIFMDRYPQWNLGFEGKTKGCDWDSFILTKKYEIHNIEKKYNLTFRKELPSIRQRAMDFDEWLKRRGKLRSNNSLEKHYIQFYKYFSQLTHLTMSGLERFYNVDEKGAMTVDVNGQPKDIERVIPIAYTLYFVMLNHFMHQFHIKDNDNFTKFNKTSKDLVKD